MVGPKGTIWKNFKIIMNAYVWKGMYTEFTVLRRQVGASYSPELDLAAVVRLLMWLLGTEHGSF